MKNLFYASGARILQLLSGVLIILLSAVFLTKANQGLLLTLNSIAAIQIFFELGFSSVILQYVGHERQNISFDTKSGFSGPDENVQRLSNIYNLARIWFSWGAFGCGVFLIIGGSIFFFEESIDNSVWFIPMVGMSIGIPLSLYSQRFWVVYEGFGHIERVYQLRACAAALSCVVIAISFYFGFGLLAPVISPLCFFIFSQILRFTDSNFWKFFGRINKKSEEQKKLFKEILFLQSKIAISWLSGFFMFQSVTPIVYKLGSPESAAVIGIGMSAILILNGLLGTIVQIKIPNLIKLINIKSIDEYFCYGRKLLLLTVFAAVVLSILGGLFIYFLDVMKMRWLTDRLPNIQTYAFFMLAAVLNQMISTQATLTRLFKAEPYLFHSILVAISTVLVMIFAAKLEVSQIALYYFLITLMISLPSSTLIFTIEKRKRLAQC
jgi:hypothetical protein